MRIRVNVQIVIDGQGVRVENVNFDLLGQRERGQSLDSAVSQIENALAQVAQQSPNQLVNTIVDAHPLPVRTDVPAQVQRASMHVETQLLNYGFTNEEIAELVTNHGVERLNRLVGWVQQKKASQGVMNPRSLICSCLAKEAIRQLPSPTAV